MYAFSKVCKVSGLDRSSTTSKHKKNTPHVPNEVLLLEELDSNVIDPLNIEEWLMNWRKNIVKAVKTNLHPKPCSSLIKIAQSELTQQSSPRSTTMKVSLYDPNTLQIVDPEILKNLLETGAPSLTPELEDRSGVPRNSITNTGSTNPQQQQKRSESAKSGILHQLVDIRRRKPMEEIQQLYTHVATISTDCAQAYVKCQNLHTEPIQTSNPELEPDALLLNVLAHQIGGLDVSLSASMDKSCTLFLEGLREITGTIDFVCDVRNASYKPLSPEKVEEIRSQTAPIARLLDKVNTMIAFNDDLRYYLIKLQMEALLVISWPLGSSNFRNYMKTVQATLTTLLTAIEDNSEVFQTLEWETQDDFLRDEYFKIMEVFYFQKRRFSNRYDSEMLQKLNYHAKWLKHIRNKYSVGKNSRLFQEKNPGSKEPSESTTYNIRVDSEEPNLQVKFRRYRDSKDLIIELTNHLLHINNSRTKFMRMAMMNDWDSKKNCMSFLSNIHNRKAVQMQNKPEATPRQKSCDILLNILHHQISGLDIALSSEIFNSIKCFLHGLYDTSCSIMSIMSDQYYDQNNHNHLPLPPGFYLPLNDGSGDQEMTSAQKNIAKIRKALDICNNIITKRKAKWKHTLLKLQLEALILTQCSPDTDIFRQYIELMAGSAENAYYILNQQWFIPYLTISWDDATIEDREVFHDYWHLLDTCLQEK